MTIKLGSIEIVIFKVTKLETFEVKIDREASKREADSIKNTAEFQVLKAKAQAMREARNV